MKESKVLDTLLEEKKRLEKHMIFIIKIYIYIYGFLFIYTGFVAKIFFFSDKLSIDYSNFIRISFSLLGFFLIIVISLFGKYGTMGIAHIIKKRLFYTYKINKIMKNKNNNLDIEHFLKIPVIYTWTTTAVIAGSIFYFLIAFNFRLDIAFTAIMITCIISLFIFPKTNIKFYQEISNYINELKKIDKIEFPKNTYYDLLTLQFLICSIFIYTEINYYIFNNSNEYKLYLYLILFVLLIIIEYVYIKRKTYRKMIFTNPFNKIKNLFKTKNSL